jgi:hypothetical protein
MSVTASAPSIEIAENLHAYVEAEIISVSGPLNADLDPGLTRKTNLLISSFHYPILLELSKILF